MFRYAHPISISYNNITSTTYTFALLHYIIVNINCVLGHIFNIAWVYGMANGHDIIYFNKKYIIPMALD